MQSSGAASGYFLGTSESGFVTFVPDIGVRMGGANRPAREALTEGVGGLVESEAYDVETVLFVRAVVRESGGMQSDVTVRARVG